MKPSPFNLHFPETIEEALQLVSKLPNARTIAGGQSFMPMLNMRLSEPDDVVDLNGVGNLAYIRAENDEVAVGAMTRQRDLELSSLISDRLPVLHEAILNVGHRQTRNRGSIGGSLCHMDPSAELPAVCVLLDAEMVIRSCRGNRVVAAHSFGQGLMSTCMATDELLVEIRFRPWAAHNHGWAFIEFARRHGDFAVATASALTEHNAQGEVSRAALVLGGIYPVPTRLPKIEKALIEGNGSKKAVAKAWRLAGSEDILEDPEYPVWYRRRIARRLMDTAIETAVMRSTNRLGEV